MVNQFYNLEDVRDWWLASHKEVLDAGKTARAVLFTPKGTFTIKQPITSLQDLIAIIDRGYNTYQNNFGISVSAAEFEIQEDKAPNSETFVSTNSLIIDIDVYVQNSKERINLGLIDKQWTEFIAYVAHINLFTHMKNNDIHLPVPYIVGITGGGIQLIYKFDSEIRTQAAEKIFQLLKKNTPNTRYKTIVRNTLGSINKIDLEFDTTAYDKQHVQRVLGTLNPKYKVLSYIIRDYSKNVAANRMKSLLLDLIENLSDESTKESIFKYMDQIIPLAKNAFENNNYESFDTKTLLEEAKLISSAPLVTRKGLSNVEIAILTELNGGRGFDLLLRDKIEVVKENHKIIAAKCPFHEGDEHYSFAIYKNGDSPSGIDVFLDFHDQKKYNLIEMYSKLMGISKADAIREIVDLTGIKIDKTSKKELKRLEARDESEHLIDKIDTENYIYYRMANKQKNCIIRHIGSGKSYIFDGLKSMVRQILKDQLHIDELSREFLEEFTELFETKILIDGFEVFAPGRKPVFKENNISLINLWVPTSNYKKAKKRAEEILAARNNIKFSLNEAIDEIKKSCPYTNIFIHQIVQYGSIEWFVNWLAMTAQFKTTPTIPFHYGNYGTGKNLFVNTILEWYLNSEYVHIVGSDEITKQFNSFLQQSSLVVIDESNLYDSKSVDTLKMLSGNKKIKIEKKGIDTFDVERHFNFMTFSNREVPAYINAQERRFTFFHTTIPLTATVAMLQLDIDTFTEKVRAELETFFAILINTQTEKRWENMNIKNGIFYRVMFSGHSFGKLILSILDNDWDSLILQLTENASDEGTMINTIAMVEELKTIFEKEGKLPLALVNRYMESLNYKNKSSVADFVRQNNLENYIHTKLGAKGIIIELDVKSLKNLIAVDNVLVKLFEEMHPKLCDLDKVEEKCISNIECVLEYIQNVCTEAESNTETEETSGQANQIKQEININPNIIVNNQNKGSALQSSSPLVDQSNLSLLDNIIKTSPFTDSGGKIHT